MKIEIYLLLRIILNFPSLRAFLYERSSEFFMHNVRVWLPKFYLVRSDTCGEIIIMIFFLGVLMVAKGSS